MKSLLFLSVRLAPFVITLGFSPRVFAQIPVAVPETDVAPVTAPVAAEPSSPAPSVAAPPPAGPTAAAVAASNPKQPVPARAEQLMEPREPEAEPPSEQDGEYEAETTAKPKRRWYGWQTLTADGVSLLTLVTAASLGGSRDSSEALVLAGALGYEFAPGILHFVHENPGRAFASFGLRLGMPLAGAVLGAAAADCDSADCRSRGAGAGFLLGMGGAIALDAAVLAYEKAPRLDRGTVVPVVEVSAQRAWFGLAGEL